ncbi:MAG: Do family serine endopeptidase [Gemmatimonadetes bacterium]|nr:Do family serine endopeptidase [Gemmatimonadota bacterium]
MSPIKTKALVLIVGLACLSLGVVFASSLDWTPVSLANQSATTQAPTTQASLRETANAFTRIAQDVTPAVVFVTGQRRVGAERLPFDMGPFEDFFDMPQRDAPRQPRYRPSGGSGVIVREDGFVLTNHHVVDGLEDIRVILNDRRQFDAEVIGGDPSTDIAVLKIDASGLPITPLSSDDRVQVGEWVLAFGNPFGLEFTMTAGIVSAIGRGNLQIINRGENPYAIEDFIQTDAAINPGNSGGPLVDIQGRVVGINTAIASRTGGYQGYGFAIPISIARRVMEQLIEEGEVRRAILGVQIQTVTPLDAEALGLPQISGVRIDGFTDMDGSPAREAGLRPQDVVLEVDGDRIETASDLQQAIAFHEPGDKVTLTVWRDGERRRIDVELGERPAEAPQIAQREPTEASETVLGMAVQSVTSEIRQVIARETRLAASEVPDGVFIADVDPLGPAGEASIVPRGIVTQVGDTRVRDVSEYRAAVAKLRSGSVVYLRIWYAGVGEQYRPIRVPR